MIYFEPGNFTLSELMALIKSVTAMILNNIAVKQNIIIPPSPASGGNSATLQPQPESTVAGRSIVVIQGKVMQHHSPYLELVVKVGKGNPSAGH